MKHVIAFSFLALSGCSFTGRLNHPIGKSERMTLEIEAADLSAVAPDVLGAIEPLIGHIISPTAGIAGGVGALAPLVLPGRAHFIVPPLLAPEPAPAPTPDPQIGELLGHVRAMRAEAHAPAVASVADPTPAPTGPMCYVNPGGEAYHQPECRFVKPDAKRMPCSEARVNHRPCKTCGKG